jgi:catechol 2,3-dioxygenase-like lactoylglutathione lyase family enzyme
MALNNTIGVRHVGLIVSNLQKSVSFYESIGFTSENFPLEESGTLAETLVGIPKSVFKTVKMHLKSDDATLWRESGFRLELIEYIYPLSKLPETFENNIVGKVHLCFTVKNLQSAVEVVKKNGGFTPFMATTDITGTRKYVYVFDPDKNPLELAEGHLPLDKVAK